MTVKKGQSIYDIAIQLYGNTADVFKLIADNPGVFTQGLSTQIEPGTQLIAKQESLTPRIQRFFKTSAREIATIDAANANVSVLSATINDAYVGENVTASVVLKNQGLSTATGELNFNWGNSQTYVMNVFLIPGQELIVEDTIQATASMLGQQNMNISGVANTTLSYKVKGKAAFVQSNALQVTTNTVIRLYDENITIASISSWLGIAKIVLSNNKIVVSQAGTLYDIEFTDTQGNQYRIPCAEGGGWTLHDVKQVKRAIVNNHSWTKQDTLHYNLTQGVTQLDNGIYIPYSETKTKIYNDL